MTASLANGAAGISRYVSMKALNNIYPCRIGLASRHTRA